MSVRSASDEAVSHDSIAARPPSCPHLLRACVESAPGHEAYQYFRGDDLDLYDEHVVVEFVERLRPMLRFDSVDELIDRMAQDVDRARELLTSTDPR